MVRPYLLQVALGLALSDDNQAASSLLLQAASTLKRYFVQMLTATCLMQASQSALHPVKNPAGHAKAPSRSSPNSSESLILSCH